MTDYIDLWNTAIQTDPDGLLEHVVLFTFDEDYAADHFVFDRLDPNGVASPVGGAFLAREGARLPLWTDLPPEGPTDEPRPVWWDDQVHPLTPD